jgi:hypothetical protein
MSDPFTAPVPFGSLWTFIPLPDGPRPSTGLWAGSWKKLYHDQTAGAEVFMEYVSGLAWKEGDPGR